MPKEAVNRILNSPFGLQLTILTFFIFFITSFRPPYFWNGQVFDEVLFIDNSTAFEILEPGFLENTIGVNTAGMEKIIVENEDGTMTEKIIPKKRDKEISYIVKVGDNLSNIAHRFGVKVSTVLWANGLTIKSSITPQQKIRIPPTDGVYYKVKKGETLSEIAQIHEIELSKVQAYNHIQNKVKVGQEIFLPEAKRIFVQEQKPTAKTKKQSIINKYVSTNNVKIGALGYHFRRPTKGVITQGYHNGHFALDIANAKNTPIYAAADGIVIKESHSGWNYGYGRFIVIDHGNGVETLYAHNNVTKVDVGDHVKKGQLISLMGNTGRVFGRTGIHLHFEVRINGRKVNPNNYF